MFKKIGGDSYFEQFDLDAKSPKSPSNGSTPKGSRANERKQQIDAHYEEHEADFTVGSKEDLENYTARKGGKRMG